jgi:hypothetical protein
MFRSLMQGVETKIDRLRRYGTSDKMVTWPNLPLVRDYRAGADPADSDWPSDTLRHVMRHLTPRAKQAAKALLASDMNKSEAGRRLGVTHVRITQLVEQMSERAKKLGVQI